MSGFLMKTSARNTLRGTITAVVSDAISAEVAITISGDTTIYALITADSMRELGLCVGREAVVLIKASFVIIVPGEAPPSLSARNCVHGTVSRCETGAITAEVVLDIGGGKTLAATISARSAGELDLAPGKPACALFDASHVLIAID
jgi:molybdate transport system regulatory protein